MTVETDYSPVQTVGRRSRPATNPELGPYFKVPKGLIQSGIAARVGPSAVSIYVALCEHANRKNGNTFSVSDRTLAADTGVGERTIREIRIKLLEHGLVCYARDLGRSYTYTMQTVEPGWTPIEERRRLPKKRRALYAV